MKKEEALTKIGELEKKNKDLLERDEFMRKEISEALGMFVIKREAYASSQIKEVETLSWFQIMKEIGKLKSAMTFYDLDGNVSELECAVENINKTLEDWKKKLEDR